MTEKLTKREQIALAILQAEIQHTGMDGLAGMFGRERGAEHRLMRLTFELADAFIAAEETTQ